MIVEVEEFGGPWKVTGPAALVETVAHLVEPVVNTIVSVYTNNLRVVLAVSMEVPITGNDEADDDLWQEYLHAEWATYVAAMGDEEAITPDAVWYVILGYRPARQTDWLRHRPDVCDVCMVHDQRMWSLLCNDPHCSINDHSPAGHPVSVPGLSTID
jgi:hypothetical protein